MKFLVEFLVLIIQHSDRLVQPGDVSSYGILGGWIVNAGQTVLLLGALGDQLLPTAQEVLQLASVGLLGQGGSRLEDRPYRESTMASKPSVLA